MALRPLLFVMDIEMMQLEPQEENEYKDDVMVMWEKRCADGDPTALSMTSYQFQVWMRGILKSKSPEWLSLMTVRQPPEKKCSPKMELVDIQDAKGVFGGEAPLLRRHNRMKKSFANQTGSAQCKSCEITKQKPDNDSL